MSQISTTVRVVDGVSPAMRSMNKALSTVLSSFERLQSTSASAVDTSDIQRARDELSRASKAVSDLEDDFKKLPESTKRWNEEGRKSNSIFSSIGKKVGALVTAYAGMRAVQSGVNLSDKMTQTDSRMKLIVDDGGSVEETEKKVDDLQKKIFASAQRSRGDYLATADAVTSFSQRASDSFKGSDEVIQFTETLNKMYSIAGATAEEQSSSMLQLTQALGSGVLRGEEFNAVFEAAPNIMQSVADYMGKPIGALRNMAAEGEITAEVVKNAILSASESVNEDFNGMKMTWAQVVTSIRNRAIQMFQPVLDKISELASNDEVQGFIDTIIQAISILSRAVLTAFELVASVASFISRNWAVLGPLIAGITAVMVLFGIASAIAAGSQIALSVATTLASIAQTILNSAMLACPLTWIVLALILVITAVYMVVGAYNEMEGASVSATGVIVGSLSAAGAFIWNFLLMLIDFILTTVNFIGNKFVAFANFFANLFKDPIGAVIHLFGDMADNVIGVIENIAAAIDNLIGTSMAETVAGFRAKVESTVNTAAENLGNGEYEKVADKLNLSSKELGLDRIAYSDAYENGYSIGKGIDDTVSDKASELKNATKGLEDSENAKQSKGKGVSVKDYSELSKNTADTADNTKTTADAVKSYNADLKYLRDIAEKEAINRFTTAKIKIDMKNKNSINSDMDIDGVVTSLEGKLFKAMATAAEGVH